MKHLWIIANWKSNKTLPEALAWIDETGPKLHLLSNIEVVVCPDFLSIEEVAKRIKVGNFPIIVGSQDLSPHPPGAYTGEEAAKVLSGFVKLSILGHSERRQNLSETDEMVANKVVQAKNAGILPLVCLQSKQTPIPDGVNLVAYEPIFAIGTGNPDTPVNAQDVAKHIKTTYSDQVEILYGGSVNRDNCKAFIDQEAINGLLIGTASLNPQEFLEIVEKCW